MQYESTRGGIDPVSSAEAIKLGIAPDGGLFVPAKKVKINDIFLQNLISMDYRERAIEILSLFLDDFSREEIAECVNSAYTADKFDNSEIAPLYILNNNVYMLELFHGPTCAFKDMALQLLPHLLVKAVRKLGEKDKIVILVATSGDTGKAALEGFKDVDGTSIIVFYPDEGVSQVQKMQMVTQEGKNVHTVAVRGNFDDTQNGVKEIFTDNELVHRMQSKGLKFSSANSINWGRLVPQIVYYFSAYCDMAAKGEIKPGDEINITVPTGNFGNILAAYYAKEMGLPVRRLICASNDNNVLTDFIKTGTYNRKREFKKTISPSMDILISSNLERLLYEVTNHNSALVRSWMESLKNTGEYTVDEETRKKISSIFWADYTDENETLNTIQCIYNEYHYLIDTHTAVGLDVYDKYVISTNDMSKTVIASTASPFKFTGSVALAVLSEDGISGRNEFELLDVLANKCGLKIPAPLKDLDKKPVLHRNVCLRTEMKVTVERLLGF